MVRRVVLLLAALLLVGVPGAEAHDAPRITAFGDSLLWEAGDVIRFFGTLRGARVDVHATGGSALCDWREAITAAVQDPASDVVVVAFSGNNLTTCARDVAGRGRQNEALGDHYGNATAAVMAAARPDVAVLWVTAPANAYPNPSGDAVRIATVDAARRWPNARVVDGGEHLSPGGRWSATLPCLPFEPCTGPVVRGVRHNVVRAPDGAHLCPVRRPASVDPVPCPVHSSGALRYGLSVLGPALAAAGR